VGLFVRERKAGTVEPSASGAGEAPFAGASPAGTPPDLSKMSPRERFDRLYNRIMQASESGDTATVGRFMPMALSAYGMLDQVDADARYHAAMLRFQGGDASGAAALADTILTSNPKHLFGLMIRAMVAKARNDPKALDRAQREFVAVYQAEQAAGREEYADHKIMLDDFLKDAQAATGKGGKP
jgi:hypothetical protein